MKQKVFVIGFHKTGTTSLELALEKLGYKVYGGDKNLLKIKDTKELKDYIKSTLKDWDAVQDMPWPVLYRELYDLYPDGKYILTLRDTDKWLGSVKKYFASIRVPLHRKIYEVPCAEGHEQRYREVYEKHNEDVIEFFKEKPNFLTMTQGVNFDYKTLGDFLEIQNLPDGGFPHARKNNNRKLPNFKLYRDLRSLYWNYKKNY